MIRLVGLLFLVSELIMFSQTPCERLGSLSLPNTLITAAETVPAGPFQAPGIPTPAPVTLPAHCRVAAVLTPSSGSHIEMEIWLPTADWNRKFQAVGNGGWAGSITFTNGNSPAARSLGLTQKQLHRLGEIV
jgi:feruloyl esterase